MATNTKEHVDHLLIEHERRLRILQVRAAQQGINVDPVVPIEIEDIERKIAKLKSGRLLQHLLLSAKGRRREGLIRIAGEVARFIAGVLEDNQTLLVEFFTNSMKRADLYASMLRLFHLQRGRSDLGRFRGELSGLARGKQDAASRELIQSLESLISDICLLLYERSTPHDITWQDIRPNFKRNVVEALKPVAVDTTVPLLTDAELGEIINVYLDNLRLLAERAGELHGRALSLP